MNELLEHRIRLSCVDNPKILTWVGTREATKDVRFQIDLRWLSTMTFWMDADLVQTVWMQHICIFDKNKHYYDPWGVDNNRWELVRDDRGGYEFLYFRTSTGHLSIGNNTGRHTLEFNGGLFADGVRLSTNNAESAGVDYIMSIRIPKIYGLKVWNSGKLILNLVPALYKGEYGLWDTIEKLFYQTKMNADYITGE